MDKVCEWCSKEFVGRANAKFCSDPHYTKCKNCDEEILIKVMKRVPKFCSGGCSAKYHADKPSKSLVCEFCGDNFLGFKDTDRFCSKEHYRACEECGTEFLVKTLTKPAKTCSKKCAAKLIDFDSRNDKAAETLSTKYKRKVTNASQLPEVKEKKIQSSRARFGVDNPSQAKVVQEKRRQTNLKRFGVENGGGAAEVQERIRKTNLERYGVENVFQSPEVKNTILAKLQERYGEGVTNPSQVESIRKKIRETMLEKYGVESNLSLPEVQARMAEVNTRRVSKTNNKWKRKLETELGVEFELEQPLAPGIYADLKSRELFIDFNPTVTHNSTISFIHKTKRCTADPCDKESHRPHDSKYHQARFLLAENEGKTYLQYFDWMDKDIFTSVVRAKLHLDENKAPARQCELRKISQKDANSFLRVNHLLGAARGQTFCVGVFYEGELVHVNTYGPARLSKRFEWEAIRSCSKMNWHVQGGLQRCDSFFKREVKPSSIVSYVDLALGGGASEAQNPGWELVSTNKPSATWVKVVGDGDSPAFVKDASVRKLSADKLLGFEVGSKYPAHHPDGSAFTNDEVLVLEGYVKVFDSGTRTFGWVATLPAE